jgi:hypothetical protein
MNKRTIDKFEFEIKDLEDFIYNEVCKQYGKRYIPRDHVKIQFETENVPYDGPGHPITVFKRATAQVQVPK